MYGQPNCRNVPPLSNSTTAQPSVNAPIRSFRMQEYFDVSDGQNALALIGHCDSRGHFNLKGQHHSKTLKEVHKSQIVCTCICGLIKTGIQLFIKLFIGTDFLGFEIF